MKNCHSIRFTNQVYLRDRLFFSQKGGFMSLHKYVVFYQEIDDEGDAREDCLEVYAYSRQQAFYLATEYIQRRQYNWHRMCST